MSIGEQIRARREELRLTQEELAEKLDISRQAVSKWESGISTPTTENLRRLSQVLQKDFDKSGKAEADTNSIADLWENVEESDGEAEDEKSGDKKAQRGTAKHGAGREKSKLQPHKLSEKSGKAWKAAAITGWLLLAMAGCFYGYRHIRDKAQPAMEPVDTTSNQNMQAAGVYFYNQQGNEVPADEKGYSLSDTAMLIVTYQGEAPDTASVRFTAEDIETGDVETGDVVKEEEREIVRNIEDRGYVLIPLEEKNFSPAGQLRVVLQSGARSVSSQSYPVYYDGTLPDEDTNVPDINAFDITGYVDGEWITTGEADKFTAGYLQELEKGQHTKDFDPSDVLLSFLSELDAGLPGCSRRTGETNSEYKVSILDLTGVGAEGTLWVKVRRKLLDTSYNKDLEVWYVSEYKYDSQKF